MLDPSHSPPQDTTSSDVFVAGLLMFYLLTSGEHPYGNGPPDLQRDNVASGALKVSTIMFIYYEYV
jgi:DNA-binding helix-hairpin-helix protein with protein kinase domain